MILMSNDDFAVGLKDNVSDLSPHLKHFLRRDLQIWHQCPDVYLQPFGLQIVYMWKLMHEVCCFKQAKIAAKQEQQLLKVNPDCNIQDPIH